MVEDLKRSNWLKVWSVLIGPKFKTLKLILRFSRNLHRHRKNCRTTKFKLPFTTPKILNFGSVRHPFLIFNKNHSDSVSKFHVETRNEILCLRKTTHRIRSLITCKSSRWLNGRKLWKLSNIGQTKSRHNMYLYSVHSRAICSNFEDEQKIKIYLLREINQKIKVTSIIFFPVP